MQTPKTVWVGQVHVRKLPSFDFDLLIPGAKGAHVWWTAWASSVQEYEEKVAETANGYGLFIVDIEKAAPVSNEADLSDVLEDVVERTRADPNYCIYATFHCYMTDD